MNAATVIIEKMRSAGLSLSTDGNDLIITPPGRLTGQQRDYLRKHKAELLTALLADPGQQGNDTPPANDELLPVSPDDLPLRLKAVAVRVCIEIHGDGPEAIAEMLGDLAHYPPESWGKLTAHFESQLPNDDYDNRRTCRQCLNMIGAGGCRAAQRGEISTAISTWKPDPERLRRCVAYMPNQDDSDQRTGRDRWPGLDMAPGLVSVHDL